MRLFIRIAILFYLFIIMLVGFTGLFMLLHLIEYTVYTDFVKYVYNDHKAGMIAGMVIAATMFVSLLIARIIYGRQDRERTIFIENPLGRVTISLSAIEDMLRRLVVNTPQIKEIRPDIIASKRGLKVDLRLVLNSEGNIPSLTADLQDMVQRKIQKMLGKEENIIVRIHVTKIASDASRLKKGRDEDEETPESPLHYHGYRA